jgi:hypothetical protein
MRTADGTTKDAKHTKLGHLDTERQVIRMGRSELPGR